MDQPILRKGYYETEWGNVAYVSSPKAKSAKDLDANERIPVECLRLETWKKSVMYQGE